MRLGRVFARREDQQIVQNMEDVMEHYTRGGGFGSMDHRKQREIARKGGLVAHRNGTAHEFTSEEARVAGHKGGQRVSTNRSHMVEIGRLGGRRSAESRRNRAANG